MLFFLAALVSFIWTMKVRNRAVDTSNDEIGLFAFNGGNKVLVNCDLFIQQLGCEISWK